jgi:hypothetical protein
MNFLVRQKQINNICCHKFNSEHLQYSTHSLHEFKVPKIPVVQSYIILSPKNDLENYAQTICIFLHHGTQFLTSNQISLYLGK